MVFITYKCETNFGFNFTKIIKLDLFVLLILFFKLVCAVYILTFGLSSTSFLTMYLFIIVDT